METAELVDYAMPLMNIERLAKDIHNHCLNKDFSNAEKLTFRLGAEVRVLTLTLAIMQGKDTTRRPE